MGDLVGPQRTADAGMLRPAVHAGLEEGAVDDQLTAAREQIEQAGFAVGPVEEIGLFHGNPRHPPSLGGQRVAGAGQGLLLDEKLLARSLPLLRRHNRRRVHGELALFHRNLLTGAISAVLAGMPSVHADRSLLVMRQSRRKASNGGSDKCVGISPWPR